MFVCPTCGKELSSEEGVKRHFLMCWKELHPYHQSKEAPHSEDIVTREVDSNVLDFFERLNNARSSN